jgi:hypothetical protein
MIMDKLDTGKIEEPTMTLNFFLLNLNNWKNVPAINKMGKIVEAANLTI